MRKGMKRLSAMMLSLAMVVSSMGGYAADTQVQAAEETLDLTGITVNTTFQDANNTRDWNVRQITSAMTQETYDIGGVTYNNYCKYQGISVSASSERGGNTAEEVIDGDTGSRWESDYYDPQYLNLDFGTGYDVKYIYIFWEDASARNYDVEVSLDGINYQTLTSVETNNRQRIDMLEISQAIHVRSIRLNCKSRNTGYGDSIYEIGVYGTNEQGKIVPVLSNLAVRDYYKYTGKYMIYFTEVDEQESIGYNVYMDDETTPIKKITGSGAYLEQQELQGYTIGQHKLSVANIAPDGQESAKISTDFTVTGDAKGTYTDIPQVYIHSRTEIKREYHTNADVTVTVIDKDGGSYADILDGACNAKIRGNSTAGAPKKPWNIKFSSKTKVLGMGKAKKWCLLANAFDKSMMRNYLALNFGIENGVTFTPNSRFVEVYMNGVYQGNYLLTEAVQVKKERVNIDAYNGDSNDILLELGTRNEPDVDHFTTDVYWTTFDVNDPEKDDDLANDLVDAKIQRVKNYLSDFERALQQRNYEQILNYMDEDSFVDFYVLSEYFKNVDFNFSSTRFYIKDDKIYAGPAWDFDLSSGNCKRSYYQSYYVDGVSWKGYYCQGMNWYRELLKNEAFYNKIKKRFAELQYVIQNLYKTGSKTTLSVDYLYNTYGMSFERNFKSKNELGAGWSLTSDEGDGLSYSAESGWTTWTQPIEHLRDWLKNRNEWLCKEWNVDINAAYAAADPDAPDTPIENPDEPTTQSPEETSPAEYGKCDLVVTDIRTLEDAYVGDEAAFVATIKNIGTASSPNDVKHGLAISVDGNVVSWNDQFYGPLKPGEETELVVNWGPYNKRTWTVENGTHTISAFIDDSRWIDESNEDNNIFAKEMTFTWKPVETVPVQTTEENTTEVATIPAIPTTMEPVVTVTQPATQVQSTDLSEPTVPEQPTYIWPEPTTEVQETIAFPEPTAQIQPTNLPEPTTQVQPTNLPESTTLEQPTYIFPEQTTQIQPTFIWPEPTTQIQPTYFLPESTTEMQPTAPSEETTQAPQPSINPAELTYYPLGDLEAALVDGGNIAGIMVWYADASTFRIQYNDTESEGAFIRITVNGATPNAGVVTTTAPGLVEINPTMLSADTYQVITLTLPSGKSSTLVLKKNSAAQTTAQNPQPTSEWQQPTNPTETTQGWQQTTQPIATDATETQDQPTATEVQSTTEDVTTVVPGEETTMDGSEETTTEKVQTTASAAKLARAKVTKATKKKSAKKVKVTLKKITGAEGYQIAISYKKSFKKKTTMKKYVKKTTATVKLKAKLAKKNKLFVRARAYKTVGLLRVYGKWSKRKNVKVKK